jgi:hypothetical protein
MPRQQQGFAPNRVSDKLQGALEGDIAIFDVGVVVRGGEAGLGDEAVEAPAFPFNESVCIGMLDCRCSQPIVVHQLVGILHLAGKGASCYTER